MRRGAAAWGKVEAVAVSQDVEKIVRWNMRWGWREEREGVGLWRCQLVLVKGVPW